MPLMYNTVPPRDGGDQFPEGENHNAVEEGSESSGSLSPSHVVPVAIIGMSLLFPDDANTPESFWSMLMEARCASREFPSDRLGGEALYHPDATRGDSLPLKGGHFVNQDLGAFDAPFFNISAADALSMDPHSRTLLETTYRALENAGIPLKKVSGSNTSCYTGNLSTDYRSFISQDLEQMSKKSINCLPSMLSGRLSWFFNLHGPNLTLDTACSSSLVALDLGCNSLYNYSADMSIVTGCCYLFSQELFHFLSNMGMLSHDSKSFSFDHRCNGYGRGEGTAALILKRMPDALRDGDTIRGVIRSIGTNHDGRTSQISHPNKDAQIALIKETYAKAGLSMAPTRYFEAHGTGTPAGDPVEAYAIGAAFRGCRSPGEPLFVGSVKANIGHLEGASGLASVIKSCLMLEKGIIPGNANFEKLNPRIDDVGLNIKFTTDSIPWPSNGLRRLSVNSFGASGTNAHVILDDAYHYLAHHDLQGNHCTVMEPCMSTVQGCNGHSDSNQGVALTETDSAAEVSSSQPLIDQNPFQILLLSAADGPALQRMIDLYDQWIQEKVSKGKLSNEYIRDLAHTLTFRRSLLPYRSFALMDGASAASAFKRHMSGHIRSSDKPQVAFVFTGQGAQWAGMAKELLHFPLFRDSIAKSTACLKRLGYSFNISDVLLGHDETPIDRPMLSQTVCTAIQIALCDLYRALQLTPSAVVGHSSGEIAAAYCAGAISHESALKLAYFRGVLSEQLARDANSGMMAVGLSVKQIRPILDTITCSPEAPLLCVACVNSPENVTVSGENRQLDELAAMLTDKSVFHRRLRVDVAYHSPYMKAVAEAYENGVGSIHPPDLSQRSPIMISSVTGEAVASEKLREMSYWVQNMLQPVLFSDAITRLCSRTGSSRWKLDGSHRKHLAIQLLVEVGPHAALQGPIRDTLKTIPTGAGITYYSSLKRKTRADMTFLSVLGSMACHGQTVDLEMANNLHHAWGVGKRKVLHDLPQYPFDHSNTYWPTHRLGKEFRFRRAARLDLLGKPVIDWNPLEARWRNFFKVSEMPWVVDHKINGAIIYPAAGMVVMAVEAVKQLADHSRIIRGYNLTDVSIFAALIIPETAEGIETNLLLRPLQSDSSKMASSWEFFLYSCDREQWHKNCQGKIQLEYETSYDEIDKGNHDRQLLESRLDTYRTAQETAIFVRTGREFYDDARKCGYVFGPALFRVENLFFSDRFGGQSTAKVSCFEWEATNYPQEHVVHPCTLDGALQLSVAAFSRAFKTAVPTAVPIQLTRLWISNKGLSCFETKELRSFAGLSRKSALGYETHGSVFDAELGRMLIDMEGLRLQFVGKAPSPDDEILNPQLCYNVQWKPDVALIENVSPIPTTHETGIQGNLLHYLSLATFKTPSMKILHLCDGSSGLAEELIDMFHSSSEEERALPHAGYIWMTMQQEQEKVERFIEKFKDLNVVRWNENEGTIPEDLVPGTYDMILLSSNTISAQALSLYHTLLRSGGKMIFYNAAYSESKDDSESLVIQWNNLLAEAKLPPDMFREELSQSGMLILSSKSESSAPRTNPRYVFVVEENSQYQQILADSLQASLAGFLNDTKVCSVGSLPELSGSSELVYVILAELERPFLEDISPASFDCLKQTLSKAKGVLWPTMQDEHGQIHPSQGLVDGLSRVMRAENGKGTFVTASLERGSLDDLLPHIVTLVKTCDFGSAEQKYETAFMLKDGIFHLQRLIESERLTQQVAANSVSFHAKRQMLKECPPLRMAIETPGLLDTLHWIEDGSYYEPLLPGEVEIKVDMIGLNFKDLLVALGRVEAESFGHECAGIVTRVGTDAPFAPGDRVCAISNTSFSSYCRVRGELVTKVPDGLTLEDAVCVPTQLSAAYYGIRNLGQLKAGETILIHSGAGGTGQWAIQVAQEIGAEIFVTVGSDQKKTFLMEHFNIPEDHIFSSRNTTFAKSIMRMTKNRGVDVVLNSLAGESLIASWNIIAPYGRFVELGRKDITENTNLPMRPFTAGATFASLEMSKLAVDDPSMVSENMRTIFQDLVNGRFRPAHPLRVMPISEVEKAMRMLQEGHMIGKIVLQMEDDAVVPTVIKAKPKLSFKQDKTYVIAGGTGGLGRAIATWMVKERGAKNLILLSRSGLQKEAVSTMIGELSQTGAVVVAPECDICDGLGLKATLEKYQGTMPPIAGCIQASMVLKDGIFEHMSYEDWIACVHPKTCGSWHLHSLLPKGLDFFILLSSIAGVVGSAGQANYAAGNTYMDALARYRVAQGERAVSMDLGVMFGHGVLADNSALRDRVLSSGLLSGVAPAQMFALLDYYCDPRHGLSLEESQVAIGFASPTQLRRKAVQNFEPLNLPFYSHLVSRGSNMEAQEGGVDSAATYRQEFLAAGSVTKAGEVVAKALFARLKGGVESDLADFETSLQEFGLDSLMAIELRAWFEKEFAANVPVFEILGDGSLGGLGVSVALKSQLWDA